MHDDNLLECWNVPDRPKPRSCFPRRKMCPLLSSKLLWREFLSVKAVSNTNECSVGFPDTLQFYYQAIGLHAPYRLREKGTARLRRQFDFFLLFSLQQVLSSSTRLHIPNQPAKHSTTFFWEGRLLIPGLCISLPGCHVGLLLVSPWPRARFLWSHSRGKLLINDYWLSLRMQNSSFRKQHHHACVIESSCFPSHNKKGSNLILVI